MGFNGEWLVWCRERVGVVLKDVMLESCDLMEFMSCNWKMEDGFEGFPRGLRMFKKV